MTTELKEMMCVDASLPYDEWAEEGERDWGSKIVEYTLHEKYEGYRNSVHIEAGVGDYVVGRRYMVQMELEPRPAAPQPDKRTVVQAMAMDESEA